MPKFSETQAPNEKAFLVYVNSDSDEDHYVEQELEGLCEAARVEVAGSLRQRVDRPTTSHFLGTGKVKELAVNILDANADVAVFDCELSAIQARNIQEVIDRPVIDRTQLILDIFAGRARTREGQLQVELAQLTYMLPRLMSVYTKFERQKGGIGMRGPGETKLETDRRMVRDRIAKLKHDLEEVRKHRDLQRSSRRRYPFPFATIVGYTSAGKSTLMNRMSGTELLADAMPFATLDPTTRKVELPDGYSMFLTDTVGFIRHLPTHLVAAFRSTLEESVYADFLIHVIDVSHPEWDIQRDAVLETLEILGAEDKPTLVVFNKIDQMRPEVDLDQLRREWPNSVAISALRGDGMDELLMRIKEMVKEFVGFVRLLLPYTQNGLVQKCHEFGRVIKEEYREDGIYVEAELVPEMRGMLAGYALD